MMEFHKTISDDKYWRKNLSKEISTQYTDQWRTVFDQKQLDQIDHICNDTAYRLGYSEKKKSASKLYLSAVYYGFLSAAYTKAERLLLSMPYTLKIKIINYIRRATTPTKT